MRSRMLKHFMRYGHLPIREDDCSYVWQVSAADRCEWVTNAEDCYSPSYVQYMLFLFCYFKSDTMEFIGGMAIVLFWMLYLFLILATIADNFFCPALAIIAAVMRLSDSIAGVTILAFGNGAPDIFTSFVSKEQRAVIVFTELISAGVFVTSIIAGSVAIIKPFKVKFGCLMRDTSFYIFALCWVIFVIWDELVYLWEAVSFLVFYLLFIVVVVIMQMYEIREAKIKTRIPSIGDPDVLRAYLQNRDPSLIPRIPIKSRAVSVRTKLDVAIATELERSKLRGDSIEVIPEISDYISKRPKGIFKEFLYDINPISKEDWRESDILFKIILIIRAPFMFLLQLFIPVVNPIAEKRGWSKLLNCLQICVTPTIALFMLRLWRTTIGDVPLIAIFLVISTIIGGIVFLSTDKNRVPKYHNLFAFFGFFIAMLTIYLVAKEVMAVLECVGYALSISDAMLGITFLAWGNSIGDLIANTSIARQGFPRMGYAACFGGPMFNTLLGLGLIYSITASKDPEYLTKIRIGNMAPGCIVFLLCSILATIIYLNITAAIARRSYGGLLYSIYFAFLIIQFLSELQVIHPLGTDWRPDI